MKDRAITKDTIENIINMSLDQLYKRDKYLVDNQPNNLLLKNGNHHVGERSIVFRLAYYMQRAIDSDHTFAGYVLDCEYNRNGDHAKSLPSFPNGTYPDIIIHQRGDNLHNLLIMEVKTYWNKNAERDMMKIEEFLASENGYQFRFGVSLIIMKSREKTELNILPE